MFSGSKYKDPGSKVEANGRRAVFTTREEIPLSLGCSNIPRIESSDGLYK
jgi:hypothetical protein